MQEKTYTVRTEHAGDVVRYFAAFLDGDGKQQEVEVPGAVYQALEDCRRHEKRQRNFAERHIERDELSEGQLQLRMLRLPPPLEASVEKAEQAACLQAALDKLPEIQRRRFLLHTEKGLTYEQIAALEGCTVMPVKRSIDRAAEKIREAQNFFEK